MCGISGYVSKNKVNEDIEVKLSNIKHRGPDNKNIIKFILQNYHINLSFFRLSIIDIKNGMQPFYHYENEDESIRKVYLLCNGEIYNYKNIIEEHNLITKSDCHVILDLYLKYGIYETLKELDGEFAFVLIDIKEKNGIVEKFDIYFCRDRFGIRPLFYNFNETGFYFSSELKGLISNKGKHVEPRKIHHINLLNNNYEETIYYDLNNNITFFNYNIEDVFKVIRDTLFKSVKDRLNSERPLGCLLSGGLDSSLIAGIASKLLSDKGERLTTFCIGMDNDSPDIEYARKVAKHINSIHHEIIIPVEKWIETLPILIKQIETYDITTIRATCGQYLLAKWISENTDIKVLLNGDGSDELCSGYIYFYNSPDSFFSHNENIRLLNQIHLYDVLRVDRGISAFGLEARVPFLCHNFVDSYLSIDKCLRNPIKNSRIEKYLLRKSFEKDNIIPSDVLWRKKEAFSDGVSSHKKSWFEYIQEFVNKNISDEEFKNANINNQFPSKESYWYKKIYDENYKSHDIKIEYWMPKWTNEHNGDPSARKLKKIY
jgi:asparagine synthase (glutamine-hydrolysing)